jgi:ATP-dependent helicase/nuclease subunit A
VETDDGSGRESAVLEVVDSSGLRDMWLTDRDEDIRISSMPSSIGATRLAQLAKEEAEDGDVPYRKGRGGTNIGRAVHSALQSVDLATGDGLDEISRAQSAAEGLPDRWKEVAALARTAMDSEVVKQAVSTGSYHREVYVGAPEGSVLIEGFIDLVFETEEGLIVVDYKTDGIETSEEIVRSMERYRLQGGTYALGLETATGKSVSKVIFLFLHTGVEFVMDDLPGAMDEVRGAVAGLTA